MQLEMRYVYQIYLDGSFSKAAKSLYITQPALSMAIQKVEADIGMPISYLIFSQALFPVTQISISEF